MDNKFKELLDKYRIVIVLGGFVLLLGTLGIVNALQHPAESSQHPISKTEANLENSSVELIKASLNVYYVDQREYPFDYDTLLESTTGEDRESLEYATSSLKDFKYQRRGDYQAYKLNYTSLTGEKKSVEGNYRNDYH